MTIRSLSGLASAAVVTAIFVVGVQIPSHGQTSKDRDVRVINRENEPVPVRDVTPVTRTPINLPVEFSQAAPGGIDSVFTVPADKRLVVEHVAIDATVPATSNVTAYLTLSNGVPADGRKLYLDMRYQGNDFVNGARFVANQPMRFTVEAGFTLATIVFKSLGGGDLDFSGTISGYLEDLP